EVTPGASHVSAPGGKEGRSRFRGARNHGRGRHDLDRELADIVSTRGERCTQFLELARAERLHRLLHQVMEQLLDEGVVHLLAGGQEPRQLARPGEGYLLTGARLVAAGRVDRLAVVLLAEAAGGVEVFQGEAERVDDAVTAHTVAR